MRDEYFAEFVSEFGEATMRADLPPEAYATWRGKLPDQLLTYWKEEGWSAYAGGLFWTVDPGGYEDLVDEWLHDSGLEQVDAFHAIARTAFGDLYLCGEKTGTSVSIACDINAIFAMRSNLTPKSPDRLDLNIKRFFGLSMKSCDCKDDSGEPLFARALATLGPLAPDEMYGFEPALILGGKMTLQNLRKVKLDQHLTILRQLATPTLPMSKIDIDALLKSR